METASCDVRDSKALPTLIQNQFMKICVIRVHCLCNFSPSGFIRVHMWLNWFFKKSALTCFLSPRRGHTLHGFRISGSVTTNPASALRPDAGSVSPSPGGEGRGEGGFPPAN